MKEEQMEKKNSNEITVKIKCDINVFYDTIEKRGFKNIDHFNLDDTFFISNDLDIDSMTTREILSKAVLVRKVTYDYKVVKLITFKKKKFDEKGNILDQQNIECNILEIDEAKRLLNAMGYKELMRIVENDLVFKKDNVQFAVKDIVDGDKLLEMEMGFNESFSTLSQIEEKMKELDIPVYTDNFFVKKAEIELNKVLNRK